MWKLTLSAVVLFSFLTRQVHCTKTILVEPGASVNLECQRHTDTTLVWDKAGSTTGAIAIAGSVQGQQGDIYRLTRQNALETLSINDVSLDEDGVYRCYTLFEDDFEYFNVTVLVSPQSAEVRPNGNIYEGKLNTLLCISHASKPAPFMMWHMQYPNGSYKAITGEWYSDVSHSNGTITRTCSVDVMVTKSTMENVFVCAVSQSETGFQKQVYLSLDVNTYPDKPVISGGEMPAMENEHYSLLCQCAGGKPAATLQWIWGGDKVNSKTWVVEQDDGSFVSYAKLEFQASRVRNNNLFQCEATNKAMWIAGTAPYIVNHTLIVHYAPLVTVLPTTVAAWEGETVELTCTVDSNPSQTTVVWYRDDINVSDEAGGTLVAYKKGNAYVLEINSILSRHSGSYQCAVENEVGIGYGDIVTVNVLHSPFCATRQTFKYAAHFGETISINCNVEAFPAFPTTFDWSQNGSRLLTTAGLGDSQQSHKTHSVLNYTIYSDKNYHPVKCEASNGVGIMQEPCVFSILKPGPAEPPGDCIAISNTSESLTINCVEVFSGGSTVYYALQSHTSKGSYRTLLNTTSLTFTIDDLYPNKEYQFRTCASNTEFWQTQQCGSPFQMTTASGPYTPPKVSNSKSEGHWPYVYAACAVGGFIVLLLVVVITVILYKTQQQKKKDRAVRAQNDLFMMPPRPMEIHDNLSDISSLPPYSPVEPSGSRNGTLFALSREEQQPEIHMVEENLDGSSDSRRPMREASGGRKASTMDILDTESTFVPLNRHHYEEDTSSVL